MWVTTEPRAILTQTTIEVAEVQDVLELHTVLDELVRLRFAEEDLVVVHDWRSLREVAPAARPVWYERATGRAGKPFRKVRRCYAALDIRPFWQLAIRSAGLAIQLATGQARPELVIDPAEALERHGITAPPADLPDLLRAQAEAELDLTASSGADVLHR